MEKRTFLLLIIIIIIMTFATCKKNKSLPPDTQTGANTIGCLLNGVILKPKGGGIAANYDCYYQHIAPGDSGYGFHVSVRDYSNTENIRTVAINVGGIKIIQGMTIPLARGNDFKSGRGQCKNGNIDFDKIYYTNDTTSGFIHISKFDEVNQIASGTFAFKAKNSFGDSVNITDGRFDMHFTR